jgi:hypothetical protein
LVLRSTKHLHEQEGQMTVDVATPNPEVLLLNERLGKWVGLFDRMKGRSLAVTKAINIAPLCHRGQNSTTPVSLEYTESGDGVHVVFRDDAPEYRVWRVFATSLSKTKEEEKSPGFRYCGEQLGLLPEELTRIILANAPEPTGTMQAFQIPDAIGDHQNLRDCGRDINGRLMICCGVCDTYAHSYRDPVEDLGKTACAPYCRNCKALRRSSTRAPAVPVGGECNDRTHVCPNDGNRWWQSNDYYHMWQQVTSDSEWRSICNPVPYGGD